MKKNENSAESSNVRSIERALSILLCFSWEEKELTLTEIATKMNLAKSTTSRLLNTLVDLGFLSKDEKTNRYVLGGKLYYLGLVAKETNDLSRVSINIMREINEITNETINLYVLDNDERVCFQQVESRQAIKQSAKIGERYKLSEGATGKSILAFLDERMWRDFSKDLHPYTDKTIVDPDLFIQNLEKIREDGFAVSVGEKDDSVGCIAAPIFDSRGNPIACLSISTPAYRFPEDIGKFSKLILDGAKEISKSLGYMFRKK